MFVPLLLSALLSADVPPSRRLAILSTVVPEGNEESTALSIHTACAQVASFAPGLQPLSRSEMLQGDLDDEIRECGSDARCIAARLEAAQIDLGALLVVNRDLDPPLISMRLIDTDRGTILAERSETGAPRLPLMQIIAQEFAALLDSAGYRVLGKVVLDVSPNDASVTLQSSAAIPHSASSVLILPPGAHQLSVRAEDYVETSTSVLVRRLEETHLSLQLQPEPSLTSSPWFWGAIAVVAAGAIVGSVFALRQDPGLRICHPACPEELP